MVDNNVDLPKAKQTVLGLYVTSGQAYQKWLKAPDAVKVLDVRTPGEYIYVGHAEMAVNIPLAFQTHRWNPDKGYFDFQPNSEFLAGVQKWAKPAETIFVMCRSGGRSAMAVNLLAKAGYANVYNITDGMEGDTVKEPGSQFNGKRMKNGWKNSGCPWGYNLTPDSMVLPTAE